MTAILVAVAGLLGAAGVSLAAAAAHVSGGEAVRAAAEIAMVHAAAVVGIAALAPHMPRPQVWRGIAVLMLFGAVLFTAAVAAGSLTNLRLFPGAAPIGGSLTIAAWLAVAVAGAVEAVAGSGRRG